MSQEGPPLWSFVSEIKKMIVMNIDLMALYCAKTVSRTSVAFFILYSCLEKQKPMSWVSELVIQ
jgi:hypothetical protein